MTDEQHLNDLIDKALARSTEPDPHVIARELLPRLTAAQRDEAIVRVLVELVTERIRFERAAERTAKPGPTRWSIASRECVAGVWKFRTDLTVDDLFMLAEEYATRGNRLLTISDEYRTLGERLRASGCATLGELESLAAA